MNNFARGLDDKSVADIIFLDFVKALDKVSHHRLLRKLITYGICEYSLNWIESFLNDPSQQVVIDDHISIGAKITSGVSQGSVLGILLFLICINDLQNCAQNYFCRLFADDCIPYQRIRSCHDSEKLQTDLEQLQKCEI